MTRTSSRRLPFLFELAVFAALACLVIRGALPVGGSPSVFVTAAAGPRVMLGAGFPEPGIRQFVDGMTAGGVIELTGVAAASPVLREDPLVDCRLQDGAVLEVATTEEKSSCLTLTWLPASQRLALGIPLHPDRMSHEDWILLPGIGAALAGAIERDRQINGDFGSFAALDRVKGIGPAKLKALRPHFVSGGN